MNLLRHNFNIAVLCGGSGPADMQRAIYKLYGATGFSELFSFVINGYDNGKSTGVCRTLYDTLGPSDFRKNQLRIAKILHENSEDEETQIAMQIVSFLDVRLFKESPPATVSEFVNEYERLLEFHTVGDDAVREQFRSLMRNVLDDFVERFYQSEFCVDHSDGIAALQDFSIGNMLYCFYASTTFENSKIPFQSAVDAVAELIRIPRCVFVSSEENVDLYAITESGKTLQEYQIVDHDDEHDKIQDIFFVDKSGERHQQLAQSVKRSRTLFKDDASGESHLLSILQGADGVILSTGTQWSSIIPTLKTFDVIDKLISGPDAFFAFVNSFPDKDMKGFTFSEYADSIIAQVNNTFTSIEGVPCSFEESVTFMTSNESGHPNTREYLVNASVDFGDVITEKAALLDNGYIDYEKSIHSIVCTLLFNNKDNRSKNAIKGTKLSDIVNAEVLAFDYDDTLIPRWPDVDDVFRQDVKQTLKSLQNECDVLVVSGNSGSQLAKEFYDEGILPLNNLYAGLQHRITEQGNLRFLYDEYNSPVFQWESLYQSTYNALVLHFPTLADNISQYGERPLIALKPIHYCRDALCKEISDTLRGVSGWLFDNPIVIPTGKTTIEIYPKSHMGIDLRASSKLNALQTHFRSKSGASDMTNEEQMIDLSSENFVFFGDESHVGGNDYDVYKFLTHCGKSNRFIKPRSPVQTYVIMRCVLNEKRMKAENE